MRHFEIDGSNYHLVCTVQQLSCQYFHYLGYDAPAKTVISVKVFKKIENKNIGDLFGHLLNISECKKIESDWLE